MKKDHFEVLLEEMKGQFTLVLEGHDAIRQEFNVKIDGLTEKVDVNSFEIKVLNKTIVDVEARLSKKIDAVAADLSAHRADTESHRGYKVCEGK